MRSTGDIMRSHNARSILAAFACTAALLRQTQASEGTYGDVDESKADFVVVGAGTAGCVVAARLCEALPDASVVILAIERGAECTNEGDLFIDSTRLVFDSWAFSDLTETWPSEPNEAALPPGVRYDVLTGNTLGGTSSINGAQWTKPLSEDVEAWGFTSERTAIWSKLRLPMLVKHTWLRVPVAGKKEFWGSIITSFPSSAGGRCGGDITPYPHGHRPQHPECVNVPKVMILPYPQGH